MSSSYPIRQIFADSLGEFLQKHPVSLEQLSAANAIRNCKTGRLGYNSSECTECHHVVLHASSCRNRHCPCCQGIRNEVWMDQRRAEVLDAPYYHVVFTVPHRLNPLFLANQKLLYELLHQASAQTLLTLAKDRKYLGATPGIIQVLHTWGQTLVYHPHMHCIISGAGLTPDQKIVTGKRKSFFIPVQAAMHMFRGKFLSELRRLYSSRELAIPQSCSELLDLHIWQCFINDLYKTDWCSYIKETFNGFGNAIDYLARYTNRIAISNARIISTSDKHVVFKYHDYRAGYASKQMRVTHEEFIRRFLLHILPRRFQKIRYYGYLANPVRRKKLRRLFELQGRQKYKAKFSKDTPADILLNAFLRIDVHKCPKCGKLSMRYIGRNFDLRE